MILPLQKLKKMKKSILFLITACLLVLVTSCGDDESTKAEPNFSDPLTFNVFENISDTEVIGKINATAESGSLSFSIISNEDGLFEIGASSGELSLVSGQSLNYEAASVHEIAVSVSDGELNKAVNVTINVMDVTDDNVMAVFKVETQEAFEEVGGATAVTINFDKPVLVEGATVAVSIDPGSMVYGVDYTTDPSGETGSFEVTVPLGARSVTFDLKIANDVLEEGDETITFTLAAGADNIVIPAAAQTALAFTVIDDDIGEILLAAVSAGFDKPKKLFTINPISGKVNDLNVSIPSVDGFTPALMEYVPAMGKLYISEVEWVNEAENQVRRVMKSIDLATGALTEEFDYEHDIDSTGVEQYLNEGDQWSPTFIYSEGTTMYIFGSSSNVGLQTTTANYATVDLTTGTVTGLVTLKDSTGLDPAPTIGSPNGLGIINDVLYLHNSSSLSVDGGFQTLDLATGRITSIVPAALETVFASEVYKDWRDRQSGSHLENGAILFDDQDRFGIMLGLFDDKTGQITKVANLPELSIANVGASEFDLTVFPADKLPE